MKRREREARRCLSARCAYRLVSVALGFLYVCWNHGGPEADVTRLCDLQHHDLTKGPEARQGAMMDARENRAPTSREAFPAMSVDIRVPSGQPFTLTSTAPHPPPPRSWFPWRRPHGPPIPPPPHHPHGPSHPPIPPPPPPPHHPPNKQPATATASRGKYVVTMAVDKVAQKMKRMMRDA